jgi:hypothetical protein
MEAIVIVSQGFQMEREREREREFVWMKRVEVCILEVL